MHIKILSNLRIIFRWGTNRTQLRPKLAHNPIRFPYKWILVLGNYLVSSIRLFSCNKRGNQNRSFFICSKYAWTLLSMNLFIFHWAQGDLKSLFPVWADEILLMYLFLTELSIDHILIHFFFRVTANEMWNENWYSCWKSIHLAIWAKWNRCVIDKRHETADPPFPGKNYFRYLGK